jgi:hypothetical protein
MPYAKMPWPDRNDKHWFSVEICHDTFRKQSGYLSMKGRQALKSLNEKREQITQPAAPRPAAKRYGKIWTKMT